MDKCPTCGSQVTIVSSDEGTNYYEPVAMETYAKERVIAELENIDIILSNEDDDICRSSYPAQYVRNLIAERINQLKQQP